MMRIIYHEDHTFTDNGYDLVTYDGVMYWQGFTPDGICDIKVKQDDIGKPPPYPVPLMAWEVEIYHDENGEAYV